jgi:ACS family glucarate transporter-like MFS transporter
VVEVGAPVYWRVVSILVLLAFINIAARVCLSAFKPDMTRELGLSEQQFGFVFGAFSLGYAAVMVPSGYLADRYGPRRFLTWSVVALSVFTACTGLFSGVAALVSVRFLFGAAEAGTFPAANRALRTWVPMRHRGLALGLLNTGSRMGAAVGLSGAAFTAIAVGWRAALMLFGAAGVLWAAFWYATYQDNPPGQAAPAPSRSVAGPQLSPPAKWSAFLSSSNFYLVILQYFACNFTIFLCFSWLLPYMKTRFGLTAARAGVYASLPFYCGAAAAYTGGFIVDALYKRGHWTLSRRFPAMFGLGLSAVCVAVLPFMPGTATFLVCVCLAAFAADLTLSPSWTVCSDIGGSSTATISGAMNTVGSLGGFASAVAFPYFLGLTGRVNAFCYVAALLNVAAAVCWTRIDPRTKLGGT